MQLLLTLALLLLQHKLQTTPASRLTSRRPCLRPDRHQKGCALVDGLALTMGLAIFLPPPAGHRGRRVQPRSAGGARLTPAVAGGGSPWA